ncbi:DUF6624 domain-containing protein [Streptomyces sp. AVP053U2]|uniref:DUF6624 domain-containing protein n=1 Tax=Streptomyces sp. AVP053U2 TaxID=1737066 RepID=UPI00073C72A4|nr:DUF6624 domain-containing protein [Streptomyces sp. AVP053U2]ODA71629.1 hypothetical protein APS67_004182 [Streptomyces sp. AVP053U2]
MTTPGSPLNWPAIGRELTTRAEIARESWRTPAHRRSATPADLFAAARKADADNALFLGEIVVRYGWPGRSQVGENGCQAAVAIAVHADQDRQLQSRFLAALHEAAQQGEATPAQWAHVQDRMLVNSGQAQLYGTQHWYRPDGLLEPHPITDPAQLDARRADAGLPPYTEQARRLRERHGPIASLSAPAAVGPAPAPDARAA